LLATLLVSLTLTGYQSFFQTMVTLDVTISEKYVKREAPRAGSYRNIVADSIVALFPGVSRSDERALIQILSSNSQYLIQNRVIADPSLIGQTITVTIPASDPFDQLYKGVT